MQLLLQFPFNVTGVAKVEAAKEAEVKDKEAEVKDLVFSSAIHLSISKMVNYAIKRPVEEVLYECCMGRIRHTVF